MATDARVSQVVAEVVSSLTAPPAARVTQLVVEVVSSPTASIEARVSQLVVETVTLPRTDARLTQPVVETATLSPPSPLRISQAPIEILDQYPTTTRVSQAPVEALHQVAPPLTGVRISQTALEIMYPFGCYGGPAAAYVERARLIRRLRRAPHLTNENKRVFYRTFKLDLERGVGLPSGQGSDPQVMLRVSRDGGRTWGEPLTLHAGALGAYTQRVIARRLGHARDLVFEVTV